MPTAGVGTEAEIAPGRALEGRPFGTTLLFYALTDLLDLHNRVADKSAGPKTFSTRGKLVARIEQLAEAKSIDLASFGQATAKATEVYAQPETSATETADAPTETEKKPSGLGVGRLARELLLDPAGYPHAEIAARVNAAIPGAKATDKSVRWYAHAMRKKGTAVPERQRVAEPAGGRSPLLALVRARRQALDGAEGGARGGRRMSSP